MCECSSPLIFASFFFIVPDHSQSFVYMICIELLDNPLNTFESSGKIIPSVNEGFVNNHPHCNVWFTAVQIDDVISQAQTTRQVLGTQRTLFGDVQGKAKQLSDKFPIIRGLLGTM